MVTLASGESAQLTADAPVRAQLGATPATVAAPARVVRTYLDTPVLVELSPGELCDVSGGG